MLCKRCFPWPALPALLATGAAIAAAPPRIGVLDGRPRALYTAAPLPTPPERDGPIDSDPAWQKIPAAGGDFIRLGDRQRAEKQTVFRVGYSPHALYIAVRCEEPEPERLAAEHRDGRALLTGDSIEIFLQPAADPSYYRFAVSAAGARSSTVFTGSAADRLDLPIEFWEASAHRAEDHWSVVMRLPYELFDSLPDEHETWAFNVNRNISSTEQRELHTWSPRVQRSFHEVEHFGALRFSGRRLEDVAAAGAPESAVFLYARPEAGIFLRTGRREQRISYAQAGHTAPRKSPVDESILYHSQLGGHGDLGIRWWNPDDQASTRWCDGRYARWHPKGGRLVFERNGKVIERRIDTGREQAVSPAGWDHCRYPSYVGEESILFAARVDGRWGLYLAGPEAGRAALRRLVRLRDKPYSAAAMAPDGGAVAYQDGGAIFLLSLHDGSVERLTRAPGVQSWPAWAHDGSAVAFLQAPEQGRGPNDLYLVRLDDPGQMFLLNRDIHPAFDWNGVLPDLPRGEALQGAPPVQALEDHATRLSNDWMTLELRPGASAVHLASQGGAALEMAFQAPDAQAPGVVRETTVREKPDGTLLAGAVLDPEFPGRATAHFVLPGHRPLLEIRPEPGIARTTLHVDFEILIQPDRLATDLVLEPAEGTQRLVLPPGPLLFGVTPTGASMLLLVTPAQQEVHLLSRDGRFRAIDIVSPTEAAGGGEAETEFFLAWLEGALYRPRLEAGLSGEEPSLHLEWAQPYQAHWRVSLSGNDAGYATFLQGAALAERHDPYVVLTPPGPDAWKNAYVYLYGRTGHTPLGIHTPMDVVTGALGVDAAHTLLQTAAARNYRLATKRVPRLLYENFFNERPDMAGPHSVFGNRVRITAETTSLAIHLHDDIVGLLAGLDTRLDEYRRVLADLDLAEPAALQAQREALEDDLEEHRPAAIDSFRLTREQLDEVRGVMARHPVYREFLEASLSAFDERAAQLAACRRFIQAVRTQAGREILHRPEGRGAGAASRRQAAGDVLGWRYYFEDDWRGEYPGEEIQ